jgi:ABC-type bacteriocin/lantibiotic exporter with double-glycine peptidase domain
MNTKAWQYYSRLYEKGRLSLLFTLALSIGQSLLNVPILLLVRYAFDVVIPSGDLAVLAFIGLVTILLYLIVGGATLYTRYLVLKISKLAIQRLRDEILQKFYTLPRAYYSEADRSRLHAIVVQDTERVDIMTNALVAQLTPSLIMIFVLSLVLIYLNWLLFLLMVSIFPLLFVISRSLGGLVRKQVHAFHRSFETFSKGMLFVLQMMDLTRLQSAEHLEIERQGQYFEHLRVTSGQMAWLRTAYRVIQSTILAASVVIILIAGGAAIAQGVMTLGGLVSFYAAVALIKPHIDTVLSCLPEIIEGNESLTTLYNLLDMEGLKPYSGTKRIDFNGRIDLESVHFQYKEYPVLRDISLTIGQGTTVALLGPNGSGKTTIAHLILGFYRPQEGQLHADGIPFDDLDIVHLRGRIGVVPQDPLIFPGTILENITYGRPDANTQQIMQASELAMVSEFIEGLPKGYETLVGEHGVLLSGGQRQRIALARAFLRQPRLLILDEPTSHLDEGAVHQFVNNLRGLDNPPTSLIISHDVEMVRHVDYVYMLNEGSIVASGLPAVILGQRVIWGDLLNTKRTIHE